MAFERSFVDWSGTVTIARLPGGSQFLYSPSPGPRARLPQTQAPSERLPGLTRLPGGSQFLYSPTLLEVLPKEAALSVLVRSLRDPSPEIRVLSLQGLGNILFHPEKVSGCGER